MKEKIPYNPAVLKWARESIGLNPAEVAKRMGKTEETVLLWENGKASPTYIQLEKLAYQLYKRPIALFFFPEPPEEETPREAFRTLPDRQLNSISPKLHYLIREAQSMKINLFELNDSVNPALSQIVKDLTFKPDCSASTMAIRVREYLGIDLNTQLGWKDSNVALKAWRNAIEKHGIYIFKEAFKDSSVSGFCLHDPEFPLIYINNSTSQTRQIFSIFHELAHLLLGTGGIDLRDADYIDYLEGDDKRVEMLCNRFAALFLVPDQDFTRRTSSINIDDSSLGNLASIYCVSREVILRKFLDRKRISNAFYSQKVDEWRQQSQNLKQQPQNKGSGSYYNNQGVYLSENYLVLAFKNYYQKKISINQLADYLGVKVSSIPGLEPIFFKKVEVSP